MFKSLFGIVEDVATIVSAPIELAASVVHAVTQPVAEVVSDLVDGVKEELE